MADILIRMEMPTGCAECKLNNDTICVLINGCIYDESNGSDRRPDCPIVELPEHGDLIDASKLIPIYEEMKWSDDYCKECMKGAIWEVEQAPVIIPSNKEETE